MTHGTRACYQSGCRALACRAANAAYVASLRILQAYGEQPLGARIRSPETAHMLRALREEFTDAELAHLLGYRRPRVELHARCGQWILVRNACKLKRLYRLRIDDGR